MSPNDIRESITNRIIAGLEKGLLPWRRPWSSDPNSGLPSNVASKNVYRGINPLLLELTAMDRGYSSRWWGTYRQWESLGGQVKRRPTNVPAGEWGTQIVLYKPVNRTVTDEDGDERKESFRFLKFFTVFNLDQVEGDFAALRPSVPTEPVKPDFQVAQDMIEATGAEIHFGGDKAYYRRPSPVDSWPNHHDGDFISVPHRSQFESAKEYVCTLFHELMHWSEIRLGWTGSYAMGELIAEIGASYVAAELNVPGSDDLENSTRYLSSWLKELRDDPSAILRAAAQASKASDYLLAFSRKPQAIIV